MVESGYIIPKYAQIMQCNTHKKLKKIKYLIRNYTLVYLTIIKTSSDNFHTVFTDNYVIVRNQQIELLEHTKTILTMVVHSEP